MSSPDTQVTATADQLWNALDRAIAAQCAPDDVLQAAEVGLAQAILGWRLGRPAGFDRFARSTITAQLRRHDTFNRTARPVRSGTRPPPIDSPEP